MMAVSMKCGPQLSRLGIFCACGGHRFDFRIKVLKSSGIASEKFHGATGIRLKN